MKACNKCDQLKDESEYYAKHSTCKECVKERVRANRAAKLEYYRERDRLRANKPKRVAARAAYVKTANGRAKSDAAKAAWASRNKHKRKAHHATNNAIRDGKLSRQPCEVCGATENIEAHHDDYGKPLDVRWLCTKHHAQHHKHEREQQRMAS